MESRLLEITSKGRKYADLQMTRDGRREKIVSVCEDLQTLVRERLACVEVDAAELKKTVKELTKKVRKLHKKDNLIREAFKNYLADFFPLRVYGKMIFRSGGRGVPPNSAKEKSAKKAGILGPKTPFFAFFHTSLALFGLFYGLLGPFFNLN